jgi:hypothetical protein
MSKYIKFSQEAVSGFLSWHSLLLIYILMFFIAIR